MRAFIFSSIIIFIMISIIILNGIFLCKTIDKLNNEIDYILEGKGLDDFNKIWDKSLFFISISTPHREIGKIKEQLVVLEEGIKLENQLVIVESCNLIRLYLSEIKDHEKLAMDNII